MQRSVWCRRAWTYQASQLLLLLLSPRALVVSRVKQAHTTVVDGLHSHSATAASEQVRTHASGHNRWVTYPHGTIREVTCDGEPGATQLGRMLVLFREGLARGEQG